MLNAWDQAAIHLAGVRPPELLYGALKALVGTIGGVALWRLFTAPHLTWRWLVAWATSVALLAGAAPMLFGRAPLVTGALSLGGSAAALGACILWWRRCGGAEAPSRAR
jgi:hypothetical protein